MSTPTLLDSLINIGAEPPKINELSKMEPHPPELKSMHVVSNVRNRYAYTTVTSKYTNKVTRAQEATFSIVLPDTAFITGFVMEIQGKEYKGYVKEKEEAKQEYQEAVCGGRAAAHVAIGARDSNNFTVSVNVEPQSDVIFILTYEELLVRKHSKYEMLINLHLGHALDDLRVDVHINETRPIINVETPALRSGNDITDNVAKNEYVTIINKEDDGIVHITFHPSVEQQKAITKVLANKGEKIFNELPNNGKGILGQFVIEYDVERDPLGGEVLVNDGYFVHFFAPTDLKPIPKHVIFVLDVSGSMGGRKLKQLKEAMKVILNELNPEDYFNLVKFSSDIAVLNNYHKWEIINNPMESKLPESFSARAKNIILVQGFIDQITDEGRTNIYDALIVGLRLTSKGIAHLHETSKKHKPQPIVVFLTDGKPNVSESDSKEIIKMVENRNDCDNKSAIFTLAFGDDADKEFLKEMAIQNSGFLRNIYEAADASLQLQDFYKQISSPILTNVNFKYSEEVKDATKYNFDILFNGAEFVVAGRIDEMDDGFVIVGASTLNGRNEFCPTVIKICPKPEEKIEYRSLERLWAYMTIKQLLDKKYEIMASDNDDKNTAKDVPLEKQCEKGNAEKLALQLALKYSFVTPLTSLVVVKPDLPAVEEQLRNASDLLDLIPKHCVGGASKKVKRCIKKRKGASACISSIEILEVGNIWDNIILKSITFDCNVKNHVARTLEKRKYFNFSDIPKEVTFNIVISDKAVFTDFIMESGGQVFKANGRIEEQAKNDYLNAVSNNQDAVLINLEDSNKINVTIHIMPQTEITFSLLYNTSLQTKNGKYVIVINLEREAATEEMTADVYLSEDRAIKNVEALPLRSYNEVMKNGYAKINKINDNEVKVELSPTVEQQEDIVTVLSSADGRFSGQFIVEYQIEADPSAAQNSVTNNTVAGHFPYLFAVIKNEN